MQATIEAQIVAAGLHPGDHLLVAVSGGVDSVVLLHLLTVCARRFDLRLSAAHLNHQIRPEGAADSEFVQRLCQRLQLPFVHHSCNVSAFARREKIGLEMAGRQLRRDFLQRTAKRLGVRLIALAHHRDDQVETFFLRLLRGSGPAGLAAMRSLDGWWWRPLLNCSRQQILAYARQNDLAWVEDSSNTDTSILRNRLRHQVLPQLREVNPRFDERLSALSGQLQLDEDCWQQNVEKEISALIVDQADGLRLDRQKLLDLHEALRVRVLREALRRVRCNLQGLEAIHLQAMMSLLAGTRSQGQLDIPGCWVARRYQVLWLRKRRPEKPAPYTLKLPIPGEVQLPHGQVLRVTLRQKQIGESRSEVEFDATLLTFPLQVRSWQPGDLLLPQGMDGHKKIKRLFGDEKIELEERSRMPLIVSAGEVLWVAGMRRSQHAPVSKDSPQILRLELLESD